MKLRFLSLLLLSLLFINLVSASNSSIIINNINISLLMVENYNNTNNQTIILSSIVDYENNISNYTYFNFSVFLDGSNQLNGTNKNSLFSFKNNSGFENYEITPAQFSYDVEYNILFYEPFYYNGKLYAIARKGNYPGQYFIPKVFEYSGSEWYLSNSMNYRNLWKPYDNSNVYVSVFSFNNRLYALLSADDADELYCYSDEDDEWNVNCPYSFELGKIDGHQGFEVVKNIYDKLYMFRSIIQTNDNLSDVLVYEYNETGKHWVFVDNILQGGYSAPVSVFEVNNAYYLLAFNNVSKKVEAYLIIKPPNNLVEVTPLEEKFVNFNVSDYNSLSSPFLINNSILYFFRQGKVLNNTDYVVNISDLNDYYFFSNGNYSQVLVLNNIKINNINNNLTINFKAIDNSTNEFSDSKNSSLNINHVCYDDNDNTICYCEEPLNVFENNICYVDYDSIFINDKSGLIYEDDDKGFVLNYYSLTNSSVNLSDFANINFTSSINNYRDFILMVNNIKLRNNLFFTLINPGAIFENFIFYNNSVFSNFSLINENYFDNFTLNISNLPEVFKGNYTIYNKYRVFDYENYTETQLDADWININFDLETTSNGVYYLNPFNEFQNSSETELGETKTIDSPGGLNDGFMVFNQTSPKYFRILVLWDAGYASGSDYKLILRNNKKELSVIDFKVDGFHNYKVQLKITNSTTHNTIFTQSDDTFKRYYFDIEYFNINWTSGSYELLVNGESFGKYYLDLQEGNITTHHSLNNIRYVTSGVNIRTISFDNIYVSYVCPFCLTIAKLSL